MSSSSRAWRLWRSDPRAVLVFPSRDAAVSAMRGVGPQSIAYLSVGATDACSVPDRLGVDEARVVDFSVATKSNLDACGCAVLELDPLLKCFATLSDNAKKALDRSHVAYVCTWWPGDALRAHVGLGERPLAVLGPIELPRVAAKRLHHHTSVSDLVRRTARGTRSSPVLSLMALRRVALDPARLLPDGLTNPLVVADTSQEAVRLRRLVPGVRVVDMADVLGPTPPSSDEAWDVVFAVAPLVEYQERLVVRALGRVRAVVAHTWTPDGDAARVDGWAPRVSEESSKRALAAIRKTWNI